LGLETVLLVAEAARRDIPWTRLAGNCVQLGHGHRQRRLYLQFTDATANIAVLLSTQKPTATQVMAAAGIPVPAHLQATDEEAAVRAARRLGYPLVLKPTATDRGIGVCLNVTDEAKVRQVFPAVRRHGVVLVERQEPGFDHRLLVADGRLIAAARRLPAQVVGDGKSTVAALVEAVNADPRRGLAHTTILERIVVDDEALRVLAGQGLRPDSVPETDRRVELRFTANLSTGGTSEDVTDRVHPENRLMAERAARVIGLDLAGIDFITTDISRSHLEVGGVVCEINPTPGFRPHLAAPGSPDVVPLVMATLFPAGGNGRIPLAMITGTNGKTTTSRMVAAILKAAGHTVGLAGTDGVEVDGVRVAADDLAGPKGAIMLLRDPAVTAAVLETARGGIINYGLGVDACSVAAVLNIGADHLGIDGIETLEDLARVKGRVLAVARDAAVLNADDRHCMALAGAVRAARLILVAGDPHDPAVARHLAAGGLGVTLATDGVEQRIMARSGSDEVLTLELARIPATFGGAAEFNVQNAMFAAAIGLGLGLPAAAIEAGLTGFRPDTVMSSGRANLIGGWPFDILVDYAHNEPALTALGRFVSRLPVRGRRLVTLTPPGNRDDAAYGPMAAAAAPWFDHFICTCENPRGRPEGDVGRRLAEGLREAGIAPDRIEIAEPFGRAFAAIMAAARPGDLAVILPGKPRHWVERLLREGGWDRAWVAAGRGEPSAP
jgi:cyanophycin synthetase